MPAYGLSLSKRKEDIEPIVMPAIFGKEMMGT
jgi:hypothetical protein